MDHAQSSNGKRREEVVGVKQGSLDEGLDEGLKTWSNFRLHFGSISAAFSRPTAFALSKCTVQLPNYLCPTLSLRPGSALQFVWRRRRHRWPKIHKKSISALFFFGVIQPIRSICWARLSPCQGSSQTLFAGLTLVPPPSLPSCLVSYQPCDGGSDFSRGYALGIRMRIGGFWRRAYRWIERDSRRKFRTFFFQ